MFFQFFFHGLETDFTVLGFFFTVFSTSEENTQFRLSLNKVPFSTCKRFPHEIILETLLPWRKETLFNSYWNYFMFFQFFFMGWKTDFTVLGFFFTENTQFQLSLNKVPFSTCK